MTQSMVKRYKLKHWSICNISGIFIFKKITKTEKYQDKRKDHEKGRTKARRNEGFFLMI